MKTKFFSLALITFLCCIASMSHAQIFYQDVDPDVTVSGINVISFNIDSLATDTIAYGNPGTLDIWSEGGIEVLAFSQCQVMMNGDYPAALNAGDTISSSATWATPDYSVLYDGLHGYWTTAADKYLGVRVQAGPSWYYGWMRISVAAGGSAATVKDYACNRNAGEPVTAGEKSTTVVPGINDPDTSVYVHNKTIQISGVPSNANIGLSLFDMGGKLRMHEASVRTATDVSGFPAGVYILTLQGPGWRKGFKIVLQ